MAKMKILGVTALVGAIALASTQLGAQDNAAREARDRAEIEALMWRYTRALDTRNADAYVTAYTPDGQFVAGGNATKGRAALHKMVADLKATYDARIAKGEPQPPMYHATLNHYIEFVDKDHARLHAYYLTAFGPAGEKVPLRIAAVGRSVDHLVRVDGKWLIQTRDVAPRD
jgi:uncharacterized protein (TIGR02246 family)